MGAKGKNILFAVSLKTILFMFLEQEMNIFDFVSVITFYLLPPSNNE